MITPFLLIISLFNNYYVSLLLMFLILKCDTFYNYQLHKRAKYNYYV